MAAGKPKLPLGHPKRTKLHCEGCGRRTSKRLRVSANECDSCGFLLCETCAGVDPKNCVECRKRVGGRVCPDCYGTGAFVSPDVTLAPPCV